MPPKTWMDVSLVFFVAMSAVIGAWALDTRRPFVSEPTEAFLVNAQKVCAVHTGKALVAGSSRKITVNGFQIALCDRPCAQKAIRNLEKVYRR
jgi:hypothetical protein